LRQSLAVPDSKPSAVHVVFLQTNLHWDRALPKYTGYLVPLPPYSSVQFSSIVLTDQYSPWFPVSEFQCLLFWTDQCYNQKYCSSPI